jgi:hypothetical protein
MAMGSTKDLHGTEEGADDNALTMPTLPERNHKKKNEPIKKRLPRYQSSLEPISLSAVVETSPLLSCSFAAQLDVDVAIQRTGTLARNDLRHQMQRASLRKKLSTPRLTEACELACRTLRKGMYHSRYRPKSSPSLLSVFAEVASLSLSVSVEMAALCINGRS